ncbi:MAG: enoyl-CoA hydratase/isomerase family protein [Acidiferrobacterales bacterium]
MTYEQIIFDVQDRVASITLNRPNAANSINLELARELMDAAIRCDADPGIRTVLLMGAGDKMFSAGGDLKSFAAYGTEIAFTLKEITTYLHSAISHFARMDAPLIVAVNGVAAGAGMSLAVAGDMVLAAESAKFTMAYTAAALSPDGSATYFVPRLIGLRRAQELMLTNRALSAREAMEWGLVTNVIADAKLLSEAEVLARSLADGPTLALGAVKQLLNESFSGSLETQMELEARTIARMAKTRDSREGISAFVGKRPPRFTGA